MLRPRASMMFFAACLGMAGPLKAQVGSTVLFVQGVQGGDLNAMCYPTLPVFVQIDGFQVTQLPVQFGDTLGPLPMSNRGHKVMVGGTCAGQGYIETVLHLPTTMQAVMALAETPNGAPAVEFFSLNEAPVPLNTARVIAANIANAPAIDVAVTDTANGTVTLFSDIASGSRGGGDVAAAKAYSVSVLQAGTSTVLAGPFNFTAIHRSVEALFVAGSAANGTVTIIPKVIHGVF